MHISLNHVSVPTLHRSCIRFVSKVVIVFHSLFSTDLMQEFLIFAIFDFLWPFLLAFSNKKSPFLRFFSPKNLLKQNKRNPCTRFEGVHLGNDFPELEDEFKVPKTHFKTLRNSRLKNHNWL